MATIKYRAEVLYKHFERACIWLPLSGVDYRGIDFASEDAAREKHTAHAASYPRTREPIVGRRCAMFVGDVGPTKLSPW